MSDIANNYVLDQKLRGEVMKSDSVVMTPIGSKVTLVVGRSDNHLEPIPDLTGMTLREVKNMLWDHGFNLGKVEFEGVVDMAGQNSAKVYNQHPEPETPARMGREVSVWLKAEKE